MSATADAADATVTGTGVAAASPPTEESDPYCLSPADAAALLTGAPWRRFAVIGDSLSAGICGPSPGYATLGWPDRVADALCRVQPGLGYLNTGETGATTTKILAGQMSGVRTYAPDLLHLPSGANDLFRTDPDFARIARELGRLYALAAETGAQLTVFTLGRAFHVPQFPDWTDRVRRVNDLTRALAAEHRAVLVDMWDHPVNSRPELLSADRIHFSASGQAVMAAEVVRGLATTLAPPERPAGS